MANYHFTIRRGDTESFTITTFRGTAPLPLLGVDIYFTAKYGPEDPDNKAVIAKSTVSGGIAILDSPNGIAQLTISPTDTVNLKGTLNLVFDIQIVETGGKVTTVATGILTIVPDTTRSIT